MSQRVMEDIIAKLGAVDIRKPIILPTDKDGEITMQWYKEDDSVIMIVVSPSKFVLCVFTPRASRESVDATSEAFDLTDVDQLVTKVKDILPRRIL
jgi:hypothetical protein